MNQNLLQILLPFALFIVVWLFLTIREKIIAYRENKRFWKTVDARIAASDQKFKDACRKIFTDPRVLEAVKRGIERGKQNSN